MAVVKLPSRSTKLKWGALGLVVVVVAWGLFRGEKVGLAQLLYLPWQCWRPSVAQLALYAKEEDRRVLEEGQTVEARLEDFTNWAGNVRWTDKVQSWEGEGVM